jgi:hypothetical protein
MKDAVARWLQDHTDPTLKLYPDFQKRRYSSGFTETNFAKSNNSLIQNRLHHSSPCSFVAFHCHSHLLYQSLRSSLSSSRYSLGLSSPILHDNNPGPPQGDVPAARQSSLPRRSTNLPLYIYNTTRKRAETQFSNTTTLQKTVLSHTLIHTWRYSFL